MGYLLSTAEGNQEKLFSFFSPKEKKAYVGLLFFIFFFVLEIVADTSNRGRRLVTVMRRCKVLKVEKGRNGVIHYNLL